MATQEQLINGLKADVYPEGIYISGNTFPNKDWLKSLGASWSPEVKMWVFPPAFDLQPLRPRPAEACPRPKPTLLTFSRRGRCCARATAEIDKERPEGPLWYICPKHGTYKSDYTGD